MRQDLRNKPRARVLPWLAADLVVWAGRAGCFLLAVIMCRELGTAAFAGWEPAWDYQLPAGLLPSSLCQRLVLRAENVLVTGTPENRAKHLYLDIKFLRGFENII